MQRIKPFNFSKDGSPPPKAQKAIWGGGVGFEKRTVLKEIITELQGVTQPRLAVARKRIKSGLFLSDCFAMFETKALRTATENEFFCFSM